MKQDFIIYGCYGYTGKLISELAVKAGLRPTLAGRDAKKVTELASQLQLPYCVFNLDNEQDVINNIKHFKIVLHCAGPFSQTAKPMANACLKAQTHYLDITGEYQVFESIYNLDAEAKKAGILMMPGVGFDVVPTDCLALYLKEQLPTAHTLELALYTKGGKLSQGTAMTVTENLGRPTMVRRNGKLQAVANGRLTKQVPMEGKEKTGVAISWGDISSGYRTTAIPNITVYNLLPEKLIRSMRMSNYIGFLLQWGPVQRYLANQIKKRPAGPNEQQRQAAKSIIWGEVTDIGGKHVSALLELPEGYTLTALTAIKIVQNLLQTEPAPSSSTPAATFGSNFIMQFEGVKRTLL
jgi:short subunit dehydrogenase-like uncharacterized protein